MRSRHVLSLLVAGGLLACGDQPSSDAPASPVTPGRAAAPAGATSSSPLPTSSSAAPPSVPPTVADAGAPDVVVTPPPDPCPTLPIPATCRNRNVVYREYGPTAVGDGTYFASQAPERLGFNRVPDTIWVVKFKTELNTYLGRVSAYGDTTPGVAYIAKDPCDPTTAIQAGTIVWGNTGGGSVTFLVTANSADAQALKASPTYGKTPQLEGGACYYAVFQNVVTDPNGPLTKAYLDSQGDTCGASTGGSCYYLAFDMNPTLHSLSGGLIHGNVIPGFTK